VSRGLLIVNADDWGETDAGTDAILAAFHARAITSTTAMVFMAGSERAAALAREHGVPTGLHLNLTDPFDGPGVPPAVRERHDRLRAHFADRDRMRWRYVPAVRDDVAALIEVQLAEYERLYGAPPAHIDSHHHVHTCPDVLFSPALPRGTTVRQTRAPAPGLRIPVAARVARRAKQAAIARRFRSVDRFWAVADVLPALGGVGYEPVLAVARERPIEVMVHPSFPDELPLLLDDGWRSFVAAAPAATYAAL